MQEEAFWGDLGLEFSLPFLLQLSIDKTLQWRWRTLLIQAQWSDSNSIKVHPWDSDMWWEPIQKHCITSNPSPAHLLPAPGDVSKSFQTITNQACGDSPLAEGRCASNLTLWKLITVHRHSTLTTLSLP